MSKNLETRERLQPSVVEIFDCIECETDFVYPLEFEPVGEPYEPGGKEGDWSMLLCCANCEILTRGTFTQDQANRFDEHLKRAERSIRRDQQSLSSYTFLSYEAGRFILALGPDDLTPPQVQGGGIFRVMKQYLRI